ncbi:mitogen-activated protein kinase kinase kinase 21-like [Amphiura filiformis]|uniref:mitogen-activated protein kinase kinase kinase 21-like n=1 Tax=Amphiura filiformis TaxID=82378 RepID=UPI003B215F2B
MSDCISFDRQEFIFQNEIGKGGFSTVYRVEWKTDKYIKELHLNSRFAAAKKLNKVDDIELQILSKLKHPNIVKLIGIVDELPRYYIILELCEGGSLREYLDQNTNKPLSKLIAHCWVEEAALAIQVLKENNVIHRDIKSHNFLITRSKSLKLTDFGISKISDVTVTTEVKGTWAWVAPEVFTEHHLSPQSDIYSYGIVVWEIFTTQTPFKGCEYQNVMWRVCIKKERPQIPDDCPEEIARLLHQCWLEDRRARPDIGVIVGLVTAYRKTIQEASSESLYENAFTEIAIQFSGKDSLWLKVPYGSTVQSIKKASEQSSGLSGHPLKLLYQGKELDDQSSLQDYGVDDGDVIQFLQYIRLHVKFENENIIVIDTSLDETLQGLKSRLNQVSHGSAYFTTTHLRPLRDDRSLAYYGIQNEDTLQVLSQPCIQIQREEGTFFTVKTNGHETVRDLKKSVQHQHLILQEKLYSAILEFSRSDSAKNVMTHGHLIDHLKTAALQDDSTIQGSGIQHGDIVCMMNLQRTCALPQRFDLLSERVLVIIPSLTPIDIENIVQLARSQDLVDLHM